MLESFIAFVAVILDQLSKLWVTETLKGAETVAVIPGVFNFRYIENTGAAFGVLGNMTLVLTLVSCVIAAVMVIVIVKYRKSEMLLFRISAAMIVGGAIGNLIDRFVLGYVVDFIEAAFVNFAIFNVADCFVTVGTILLGVYILFFYEKNKKRRLAVQDVPEGSSAAPAQAQNAQTNAADAADLEGDANSAEAAQQDAAQRASGSGRTAQ